MSGADEAEHALVQSQLREETGGKAALTAGQLDQRSVDLGVRLGRSSSLRRALR